jgi:hypothetical protein
VVDLASKGEIGAAATDAVRAQLARGLSVVFQRGRSVIRQYPDGHEEIEFAIEDVAPLQLPESVRRL